MYMDSLVEGGGVEMMVAPFHFSEILMLMLMNGTVLPIHKCKSYTLNLVEHNHTNTRNVFDFCLSPCTCTDRSVSINRFEDSYCPPPFSCCICLQQTGNLSVSRIFRKCTQIHLGAYFKWWAFSDFNTALHKKLERLSLRCRVRIHISRWMLEKMY